MRISKLEPSKRKRGRWLVFLENGEVLRVGENEVVALGLYAGMDLDGESLTALTGAAQAAKYKEAALDLIAARPLSRFELIKKLTDKDCPSDQAEAIADRLEQLGYLDDGQYAKTVAKHYAAKDYGPYKIKDELYRRGVPREHWEDALAELEDSAESLDAFVARKLAGVEHPDRRELKRVSDALSRRGYSWQEISAALDRYADGED